METFEDFKNKAMKLWQERWSTDWPTMSKNIHHGSGWSVALEKKAVKDTAKGINQKTTKAHTVVRKPDGQTEEKTFGPFTSSSWIENEKALYPQINAWCESMMGTNPMLKEREKKAIGYKKEKKASK